MSSSALRAHAFLFSSHYAEPREWTGGDRALPRIERAPRPVDPADLAAVARVRECADDDARTAFDAIYEASYARLVRFAYRLVGDETAHDIVQDVFVAVWMGRRTWQAPAGSVAYLYSAVRNRALKRLRHESVVRVRSAETADASSAPSTAATQDSARSVELAEFDAALSAVLAELPERRRTAFLLRAMDELGYDDIGAVLGISGPAAFKQVAAAVRILKERLVRFAR